MWGKKPPSKNQSVNKTQKHSEVGQEVIKRRREKIRERVRRFRERAGEEGLQKKDRQMQSIVRSESCFVPVYKVLKSCRVAMRKKSTVARVR